MRGFPKNQMALIASAICLAAAFFALDLALPLGVAGGVPYVALVLLGWWFDRPRYLVLLGAVATALTIAGYYFSAEGGIEWMVLANRALAFFAIWITVGLLVKAKSSENALRIAHSELEQRAEALRESEARYARAVSGTNDGLWDWDIRTGENYRSPRWEEIVGYGPGELEPVRQALIDLIHPDDRKRVLDAARAHLDERVPYDLEFRLRHKSGEYVWARSRGQAIWDAGGKPLRMAGSLTDITRRKRAEEQIQKLNETLERRVEERTSELRAAQDALLRKERLATLGQLTGTVAHELRNPLGTIANAINVIGHKCASAEPDLEKTLERAERSIKRCDTIVTELLDFARAKGLQREPTVVDAWLAGILEEQHIPEAVTVTRDFQADAAAVAFDRDELRRAVINLVDNACQAMIGREKLGDAGIGGELTLSTRMNGERVEIAVADSGPGIPAAVLPQVLEPLFSTKTFGTGLGLPTVQQIMEAHGGGLEITSREHCGTKVVLWLPLEQLREAGVSV